MLMENYPRIKMQLHHPSFFAHAAGVLMLCYSQELIHSGTHTLLVFYVTKEVIVFVISW
jgi:hypothetical protein